MHAVVEQKGIASAQQAGDAEDLGLRGPGDKENDEDFAPREKTSGTSRAAHAVAGRKSVVTRRASGEWGFPVAPSHLAIAAPVTAAVVTGLMLLAQARCGASSRRRRRRTPKLGTSAAPKDEDNGGAVPQQVVHGGEHVLYMRRAKVYRLREDEWQVLGVGEVKLLSCMVTGRVRFLARAELTGPCMAHHCVSQGPPFCKLVPNATNAGCSVWCARDVARADEYVVLAVKFTSQVDAREF